MIKEAVIQDIRSEQLDLAARAAFAEIGDQIYDSRTILNDILYEEESTSVSKSAEALEQMVMGG